MVTKASNANLDLVNPPISNIVTRSLTVRSLDSVLIGAPDEQGKREPQHASLTINAMFPTIRNRYTHNGLDYVDLELPTTFPGIPTEFTGVSGGGFWDVLIYGTDSGETSWSLRLMGMACWQLEIVNDARGVRCLGAKSIRSLLSYVS